MRARDKATVSAPTDSSDLHTGLRLEQFTLETMSVRLKRAGDLWSAAMSRRNSRRAMDALLGGL